jgi:cell division protease FtsH
VLATHEAGHAIVSLNCPHSPPIERITIESENSWAFGYVQHQDPAHRYIYTRDFALDSICVALAAREAEQMLLDDMSLGATGDLQTATAIAHDLVEIFGLGGPAVGVARYRSDEDRGRRGEMSEAQKEALDRAVQEILEQQRERAIKILNDNRPSLELLIKLLLEKKTVDAKSLRESFSIHAEKEEKKNKAREAGKKKDSVTTAS